MHKAYVLLILFLVFAVPMLFSTPTAAISNNLVISQVQIGDKDSASNELIELYNNSEESVNITDWCLKKIVPSSGNEFLLTCFTTSEDFIILPGYSSTFVPSLSLATKYNLQIAQSFSSPLADNGHLVLLNKIKKVVDEVSWSVETVGTVASAPDYDQVLSRKVLPNGTLQDTDDDAQDFELLEQKAISNYIDETTEGSDVCSNIEGVQLTTPLGYDNDGVNCFPQVVDLCLNLEGVQEIIPDGLEANDSGVCSQKVANEIKITELLPNTTGSDTGKEFIEFYNSGDDDVLLDDFSFSLISANSTKKFAFPVGLSLMPGEYRAIYNSEVNFSLNNTGGSVQIADTDGNIISETDKYEDPKEDMAWALIDDLWQFTNVLTPNFANKSSVVEITTSYSTSAVNELKPCPAGQYRNPETNRCKAITSTTSTLVPCKDGQYRSEETNRCRNIASDAVALAPCKDGQYRNPETNRCKSIVSTTETLTPCPEGQERNPLTNRCRKVVSAIPEADYKPVETSEQSKIGILAISLAGVGIVAIGYAVWEWRSEISNFFKKVVGIFKSRGK